MTLDCKDFATRDLIVAIEFKNLGIEQAVEEYENRGHRLRTGRLQPLSRRMLEAFHMTGAIRVSPLHCNSLEDIKAFLAVTVEMSRL